MAGRLFAALGAGGAAAAGAPAVQARGQEDPGALPRHQGSGGTGGATTRTPRLGGSRAVNYPSQCTYKTQLRHYAKHG